MGDTFDVIMAAYPAAELADRDFDAAVRVGKEQPGTCGFGPRAGYVL